MQCRIICYLCVRPLSSQPIFFMALRTGSDDWPELLSKIGIPADSARTYAKILVEISLTKDSLTMTDHSQVYQYSSHLLYCFFINVSLLNVTLKLVDKTTNSGYV